MLSNYLPGGGAGLTLSFVAIPQLRSGTLYIPQFDADIVIQTSPAQTVTFVWGDGSLPEKKFGNEISAAHAYATNTARSVQIIFTNPAAVTSFAFWRGRIQQLSGEYQKFKKLDFFDLRDNDLVTMPDVVLDIPSLITLILSGNPLTSLPKTIGRLINMQNLILVNYKGTTFPDEIGLANKIRVIRMRRLNSTDAQLLFTFPTTFPQVGVHVLDLNEGTANTEAVRIGTSIPVVLQQSTSLKTLILRRARDFQSLAGIENLVNMEYLDYSQPRVLGSGAATSLTTGALPSGWANLTKLKTIRAIDSFTGQVARLDTHINDYYNIVTANAAITGTATLPWRGVTFNISGTNNPIATGTYQMPTGYVQGTSNGTPASPKERLWVLANQYGWIITQN